MSLSLCQEWSMSRQTEEWQLCERRAGLLVLLHTGAQENLTAHWQATTPSRWLPKVKIKSGLITQPSSGPPCRLRGHAWIIYWGLLLIWALNMIEIIKNNNNKKKKRSQCRLDSGPDGEFVCLQQKMLNVWHFRWLFMRPSLTGNDWFVLWTEMKVSEYQVSRDVALFIPGCPECHHIGLPQSNTSRL